MKTVQIYNPEVVANAPAPPTAKITGQLLLLSEKLHRDRPPLLLTGGFADIMLDAERVNALRKAVRSWFTAFVPDWEEEQGLGRLREHAFMFGDLDDFLGDLIVVAGQNEVRLMHLSTNTPHSFPPPAHE